MNFFEQELRKLFGDGSVIPSPSFTGRICLGTLGKDLRVRAEFVTLGVSDQYEALQLTVLNRTGGAVDRTTLKFRDIWGRKPVPGNPYFKNGVLPHIWTCDGELKWYGYQPTQEDRLQLCQAADQYLNAFRETALDRAQSQNGPRLVYICAPLRGNVEQNIEFARQKAQEVFQAGDVPICPHLMFPPIADPCDPVQDQAARDMGLRLLESCQQVNVYGSELTEGMLAEIGHASKLGIPVTSEQQARTPAKKHSAQKRREAR